MMKKGIFVLALLAILATGAFAQGFSLAAGGGLLFDWSFNNGVESGSIYAGWRNMSFGGYGFFDATYAEVDVSFAYGLLSIVTEPSSSYDPDMSMLQLGFSVLGKFPIGISKLTIFPLLGVSYNLVLSAEVDGVSASKPSEDNQLGFLAGAGLDFPLTGGLFLRGETLFHLRLPSEDMNDQTGGGWDTTFGMGPQIKIGVGYKF